MENIALSNFNSPQGRAAFQRYWYDLVVDQNSFVLPSLIKLWQTAVGGKSFTISSTGETYSASNKLGVRIGTKVFMEEIVVKHYFNNVQAFVYLGAVLLLIFLALRFAGHLSENVALIGILIEVVMLIMLFAVLFYTPEVETVDENITDAGNPTSQPVDSGDELQTIREVLQELEEIGGTYASIGIRLEEMTKTQEIGISELTRKVDQIKGLEQLEHHTESLKLTNEQLGRLVETMDRMNERIELLFSKELEFRVRQELERHISSSLSNDRNQSPA